MNLRFVFIGEMELLGLFKDFFKGLTFMAYAFLFLYLLRTENGRYLKVISHVHFVIILFSLLHHPISPFSGIFGEIKSFLLTSNSAQFNSADLTNEMLYIKHGISDRFRLSGPFSNTITFSYFAFSSYVLHFYLFIKTKKKYYLFVLALLFICAIFSQTRSLIAGLFFITAGYFFLSKFNNSASKFLVVMVSFFAVISLTLFTNMNMFSNSRVASVSSNGGESDSRPLLWLTGVTAVFSHPLGVSDKDYDATRYIMAEKYGMPALRNLSAHNGFINVGFHYTFIGYILFLSFLFFVSKTIRQLQHNYKILFALTILGYLIHTSFHNTFVFDTDYPFLYLIMIIGFEFICNKEKVVNEDEKPSSSLLKLK
ncbi:O-antigen ligase family protein [uncultured Croceitalea sp.]|uniref:O-antigen ligase family protein n=1 Tax=uncultured Croceitalea sp. TaxID=1798908 RepID=UPI00330647F0